MIDSENRKETRTGGQGSAKVDPFLYHGRHSGDDEKFEEEEKEENDDRMIEKCVAVF